MWTIERADPQSKEWSRLLESSSHLVFHESVWADVLTADGREALCGVFLEEGEVKGGFLGFVVGVIGCRVGYFGVPYGGIIGCWPESELLAQLLQSFGKANRLARIQLIDFPGSGMSPLAGFEQSKDQTHLFCLADLSEDSLRERYRRQLRQDLRKLESQGVTVREGEGDEAIENLYQHYLKTMKTRGGLARYSRQWLSSIKSGLGDSCHLYLAEFDEQVCGAMMVVDSKKHSHGLMLVSAPNGKQRSANKLLLDAALRGAISRKKEWFDFMPSGSSAGGVTRFKKLFGAEEVTLLNHYLAVSWWRDLLWRGLYAGARSKAGRWLFRLTRE